MYAIGCKLDRIYYVPEKFSDGNFAEIPEEALKFGSPQAAIEYMIDKGYSNDNWYQWEVVTL